MLTQEYVRELFDYCADTGELTWRERPERHFKTPRLCRAVNTMLAGTKAGTILRRSGDRTDYYQVTIDKKNYRLHRVVFLYVHGYMPDQVDHINHNGLDNRIANLRDVSNSENHRNMARQSNNTSGAAGVTWDRERGKWYASIKVNRANKYLGRFERIADAVAARKAAESRYGFHANHGLPRVG